MRARRLAELGAQGCGDSEHAQSRQSRADLLCTPGAWVLPLGLSRLRFPWPGNRHSLGRAESSLESSGPRPTASIGAAPGSKITHPIANSPWNPVGLCSHPVIQSQHGLAARVPNAARMPCTQSQEIAMKQLPVPACATPWHEIPPVQAPPPSARLCSWHSRAQRLPSPAAPPGLWHQVCQHRARAQEAPRSFPRSTHPGFDRVSGKREGDKEWELYLSCWVSLAWSTARSCAPGACGDDLARSHSPVYSACAWP